MYVPALQSLVVADVSEVLWNRTGGLCGQRDGVQDNDWSYSDGSTEYSLSAFLQAWQAKHVGGESFRINLFSLVFFNAATLICHVNASHLRKYIRKT